MRRILVASALLSPLVFSAAAVASNPASDVTATTRPVSTGVKSAHVISSVNVQLPSTQESTFDRAAVVVHLNVDANGKPQDVEVVKSPSIALNSPVLEAVRQFRFEPATVNNQIVSQPVTLTVVFQK
jgi:periplasmic protein TonB